jgi:hypothetical protein
LPFPEPRYLGRIMRFYFAMGIEVGNEFYKPTRPLTLFTLWDLILYGIIQSGPFGWRRVLPMRFEQGRLSC